MRKFLLATMAILWLLTGLGGRLAAQENIAVWKFPTIGATSDPINADCVSDLIQSSDCELTVLTDGWTVAAYDFNNTNTVLCGVENDATKGLRLVNTGGNFETASVEFRISTAPFGNIQLSYDHRIAAAGGYATETWSYSTDGYTYTDMSPIEGTTTTYETQQVDFSSVGALNGRTSVWFKLTVSGATVTNAATIIDNVVFTGTPFTCKPPINLAAVADDAPTEAVISWAPQGTNEESYTLVYYTGSLNAAALNSLIESNSSNVIANVTSPYTLTDLNANTNYYIYLRANCGGDDNSLWASTTVHTPAVCVISGLAASDVMGSTASLSWTTEAAETQIRVFNAAKDNPWATTSGLIVDETLSGTSYDLTGLSFSTTYYVYARAACSANNVTETASTSFTTSFADGIVTVGEATGTNSYLPTYSFYSYSLSEQIYTAAEIGTAGTIEAISFYNSGSSAYTRSISLYMLNTDKETFASATDWVAVSSSNLVYSGSVTFAAGAWTTITLTNPLDYLGGDNNLLVAVDDNTGSYESSMPFNVFAATNQSIYVYSDDTNYNPVSPSSYSGTRPSVKNQILLAITPFSSCPKPNGLAANEVTESAATITWVAVGEETQWILKYGPEGFDVETAGTEVSVETTPAYSLTGLSAATIYDVYVKAVCAVDDESAWRKMTFNTLMCAPEDMCEIRYSFTDGYGDGWNDNAINVIDVATGVTMATWTILETQGASATGSLAVCDGRTIRFEYVEGEYPDETSYVITDISGTTILSGSDVFASPVSYTVDCPDCMPVTNFTVSDITATSASVSWISGNSAWQYQLNDGEIITVDSRQITLDGLFANSENTIAVRAICGQDEYSSWVTETFSTPCDVILIDEDHVFTEGFEGAVRPGCWSEETSGTHYWVYDQSGTYDSYTGAHTGNYNASYRHVTRSDNNKLITPVFDFGSASSGILEFWRRNPDWGSDIDELRVYYRTSASGAWTLLSSYTNASDDWTKETITLPNTNSTYQIAFEATDNYGYGLGLDDIVVRVMSSAAEITAFSFAEDAEVADIDSEHATITCLVSHTTESLTGLVPTISISDYASIAPESGVAQDFSAPVTYTVTAENGTTTKEWTVNVSKVESASSFKDILSFTFSGQSREADIDTENHTVTAYAAWNYDLTNDITPTIVVSPQATISPASGTAQNFATPVTYTVTAEDESTQQWTVTIVNDPNACVNPEEITVSNVGTNGATISWTQRYLESSYNVKVSTTALSNMTATAGAFDDVVSATTLDLTGLTENTMYYVYVQSACGIETWISTTFRTSVTPATIPYDNAFEDATENEAWVLINGTQTNKWYIGPASSNGGNGLYITNDNGTTNAYTTGSLAFSYAYRTISMGTGDYVISYDWKAQGESSSYDFIRVWLAPASFVFTPGQAPNGGTSVYNYATGNNPSGWISLDESHSLNQASSWQSKTLTASVSAGTYNLVFMWANDGSGGTQPPASVDNISITQITCPVVADIEAENVTTTSADITWTERGTATVWDVVFSATALTDAQLDAETPVSVDAESYQVTELTQNTPYYIYVRAHCSDDDMSDWEAMQFRTECGATSIPFAENFNGYTATNYYTAGVMPDCWSYIYNGTSAGYAPHVSNSTSYVPMSGDDVNGLFVISSATSDSYGNDNIVILPSVEGGYANQNVSFVVKTSSTSNGVLKLGYMNGNNSVDLTNVPFTSSTTSFSYVVPNTVPADAKLAMKFNSASGNVYFGIDNVLVRETSSDNTLLSYSASTEQGDAICGIDNDAHTISVELRGGYVAGVAISQTIVPNDENASVKQQIDGDFVDVPATFAWYMTTTDTTITYKVIAENGNEQVYTATVTVESCAASSALVANQTSPTNVNCSWTPAEGTTAWNFYYSTTQMTTAALDALTASDYTTVNTASASATVVGETTYFWYVRTDCSGSYSAWQESSFTTWENCVAPTNVTTTVVNDNDIVVSWDAPDNLPVAAAVLTDDFERDDINGGSFHYTNDATYPWGITTNAAHGGTHSAKSGNYNISSSTSSLKITADYTTAGTISFSARVSSEQSSISSDWDYGTFYIDNVQQGDRIVNTTTFTDYTYNVSAGTHTFEWRYKKDASVNSNDDCFYVDDITMPGLVPGGNSDYVVYRDNAVIATIPATQTSYTDEGLDAGHYCYTVSTVCREGNESEPSAAACQDINACMTVTNMSATNVTPYSATINWTRGDAETAWNLMVNGGAALALTETSEGVTVNENVITYALSGLEPMTDYTVTVQSDCGGSLSQSMTSVDFTTERVPATLPYVCDFEDAAENNDWVLDNGTQTNKWFIGTVANNGGANGLYISNDGGTTNAYTNTSASYVYAYRTINVENTTDYAVSYNWKAYGESENYDYIRAWLVPSSVALTPGQMPNGASSLYNLHNVTPDGWISLDGGSSQNMVSSWQSQNVTIEIPAGTYNLVFFWGNDGSGGTNPPAAIDNVSITEITCPVVADITANPDDITDNSAVITWVERGPATNWEVIVSTTEVTDFASATAVPVTETSYSATGLDAETLYHVYVRANCGTDDNSEWVSTTFSTVAACATPDGLQATNVYATTATITWNGYTATQWTLEYRIGTTGAWTPVTDLTAATYTLTTTGNTTYNVRIKAVCGVDVESDYSAVLSFTTPCEALTVDEDNPYTEDFETTTASYSVPDCWERLVSYTSGSSVYPYVYNYTSYAHGGSRLLYMYVPSATTANENIVALPPMNNINTLRMSLWARYGSNVPQAFEIGYVRNGVFTPVTSETLTTTHQKFTVYFNEAPADAQNIAIRMYHGTTYSYVYVDDINVSVIPSCIEPANVIASNIATTTASISWTDVNPATAWQYQINGGEIVDVNAQPVELTDLAANTAYTVNVRTVCGTDEYSAWSNVTFVTACDIISALPWSENFNSLSSGIPNCWDNTDGTTTTNSYKWNFYSTGHDGAGLRFDSYVNSTGNTNMLKSPIFDLSAYNGAILKFWYKNPTGGDFSVYVSTDGGTTYTQNPLATGLTGTSSWTEMTYDLSQYMVSNVVVVFKGTSNYGSGDAYIYLDDVSIHEPSSAAEIVAFSFAEEVEPAVISSADATVTSVVSYSTESLSGLVPTISISDYATISPASGIAQDFSNPVVYTVTAEDGTEKVWTINVSKMASASTEKDILSFTFNGQVGESVIDATAHTVTAVANLNINLESPITPTIQVSPMATISPASGVAQTFSEPVTYIVTAEDESTQEWIVSIVHDSTTLASLPYSCDFEDATENANWVLENGTQTNKWYIGTAANNGGANGLYISNNNGTSNSYGATVSYVYAYRQIIVEEAGNYDISFDWKANGESTRDLLRAFAIPTTMGSNIAAGYANGMTSTTNTNPTGWIDVANPQGKLNLQTTWQHSEKSVSLDAAAYNLVFFWKNDGSTQNMTPAAVDNISIERSSFTITASAEGLGSISPSGEIEVADGATQSFTMTPIAGFALSSLLVDGVDQLSQVVDNTYTLENIHADHTIVAYFDAEHIITATAGNGGTIDPAGQVHVGNNGNMTFTVTANEGYVISSVLVDNTDELITDDVIRTTFTYTFTGVTDDHTIAASFAAAEPHTITATAGNGGSISPSGQVSVPYNGTQVFELIPNEGYRLSGLVVDNVNAMSFVENNTYTFNNVVTDHTINASFAINSYNLTIHYVYADNTTAAPDYTENLDYAAPYSVESPAITGYTADQPLVEGTMPAQDVEVTVRYDINSYTLTIRYVFADNTEAAPTHTESVAYGADYSVESPVLTGYTADQLVVEGTMQTQDVEVTVNYTANEYTLTIHYVYADNNNEAAPDYTETVAYNTAYSVESPVIAGYTASQTTVAGTMPAEDVEVTVTYSEIETYTLTIHYVYADNTPAADDYTATLEVGATYSVASPTIDGYTASQAVVEGTMPAEDVTVTVTYTEFVPETYTLTIHYVYADNTPAADDYTATLEEGATYSVASPAIAGYTASQAVVAGTMPAEDVTVTVTYTADAPETYTLTIHYVYDNNTPAADDYTATLEEGATYSVASPAIAGYTASQAVVAGTMPAEDVTVTVTYTADAPETYTLTIHYVYADNTAAADDYTATLAEGEAYSVESPVIAGYTADQTTVAGTMPANDVEVTVRYTANSSTTYTIIATASENGTITPNGIVNVVEGANQTFTITPAAGYRIATVMVDNVNVIEDVVDFMYTFYNVTANHTINVTFTNADAIDEYTAGSMAVYPNPNNGMFSIDFSRIEGDVTYQLINANGAVVETRDINVMDGDTMNFSYDLRPGTYFVRIITADKVYVEQIVVE